MNFKKALHIVSLVGLAHFSIVSPKNPEVKREEACEGIKEHARGICKDTGKLAESIKDSTVQSAENAAESVKESARNTKQRVSEAARNAAERTQEAARNAKEKVCEKVSDARNRVGESIKAAQETSLVTRTMTTDTERAGLTSTHPPRYRIEICFAGFEPNEITIIDHFSDAKPWVEIIAERKARTERHAHGFENSFFAIKRRVIQRAIPPFVNIAKGKYTKFIDAGIVAFEFDIAQDQQTNPNILGLDTERITVS